MGKVNNANKYFCVWCFSCNLRLSCSLEEKGAKQSGWTKAPKLAVEFLLRFIRHFVSGAFSAEFQ